MSFKARAGYDFNATGANQLTLKAGDIVEVHDVSNKDWWYGAGNGKEGYFPAAYVEKLPNSAGGVSVASQDSARRAAEEEAKRKDAEEARRKAAEAARKKAAEEARRKAAEEEAKRKAAEERRKAERRKAAEEEARRAAEAKAEEERRRAAAAEKSTASVVGRCRALYDCPGVEAENRLDLKQGDIINLHNDEDTDWWYGELNGKTGYFPANYVERLPTKQPTPLPSAPPKVARVVSPTKDTTLDLNATVATGNPRPAPVQGDEALNVHVSPMCSPNEVSGAYVMDGTRPLGTYAFAQDILADTSRGLASQAAMPRQLKNPARDAIHGIGLAFTSMVQYCRGWFSGFSMTDFQKAEALRSSFQRSENLATRLPIHCGDDNLLHVYLSQLTTAIRELRNRDTLFIPGAVLEYKSKVGMGKDAKESKGPTKRGSPLMMVIHKVGRRMRVGIVNTSSCGNQYHPISMQKGVIACIKYGLYLGECEMERVEDSAFWMFFF
mmetsp:Transcript_23610/g.46159  ORF Transcript_23610/g.46159 Transcript_23610/m.46159 type:complete len:496 (-) Transcript_23610:9632-11119(-)